MGSPLGPQRLRPSLASSIAGVTNPEKYAYSSRHKGLQAHPSRVDAPKSSLRKEVIQPQVPLRLPCYDLVPITRFTVDTSLPKVRCMSSGTPSFRGLTGGVYKAQERIHRAVANARLLAIPTSWRRIAASNPN